MAHVSLFMAWEDDPDSAWLETKVKAEDIGNYRPAEPREITIEAMADMLDQDAENINAHDFVCAHRGLAVILYRQFGREAATETFRTLVDFGGLHGMLGICGRTKVKVAEKALGVSLSDWSEWKLTD